MHTPRVAHIVVVEDTEPIARLVADHLTDAGHRVDVLSDGERAVRHFDSGLPDVVVLDLMLPGRDGLEVCRAIRAQAGSQPIVLMLTARAEESDAMAGYEAGADDYVRKPFGVKELVARVQALLQLAARRRPVPPEPQMQLGMLRVDRQARTAAVGDQALRLTPMELDLLGYLCAAPSVVHERSQLLRSVWGYEHAGYARTVDSHVTRLRRKLSEAGWNGAIVTVHGVGYRLEPEAPAS